MIKFYQSFLYALNGLMLLIKTERNFRIMGYCCIVVLAFGLLLNFFGEYLNRFEWAILWLGMGLVFVSEGLNTALETTIDKLHPEIDPIIGRAKDMAAGATLAASIVAIIVGFYIFLPHIMSVIQGTP